MTLFVQPFEATPTQLSYKYKFLISPQIKEHYIDFKEVKNFKAFLKKIDFLSPTLARNLTEALEAPNQFKSCHGSFSDASKPFYSEAGFGKNALLRSPLLIAGMAQTITPTLWTPKLDLELNAVVALSEHQLVAITIAVKEGQRVDHPLFTLIESEADLKSAALGDEHYLSTVDQFLSHNYRHYFDLASQDV